MASPDDPFRFQTDVEVRFRDIDVGGHAHHSMVLVYFEEARWAYLTRVFGPQSATDPNHVLAEAGVRWHRRILWPQTVTVGVRVSAVGRKHFRMEYEVRAADGEKLASGHTVQVMYDYAAGRSQSVPQKIVEALSRFEGRPLTEREE